MIDLKNTLIKKAKGFVYEEKNTIVEHGEVTREEIKSRVALPDVAAINLLLKNLDRDFWRNDPAEYELKKRMVEVQEKKAEEEEWEDVQGIS